MKAATLSELKKELNRKTPQQVLELCLRLGRFKKENKELITYLLFEADNEQGYIQSVKQEIDTQYEEMNRSNLYLAKKSIRKILRNVNKYNRYSGLPQTAVELLIYFCYTLKNSGIPFEQSVALANLYQNQLRKINLLIDSLHEDLQYDFRKQLDELN
ncbi:MAG: hypothetical protein WCI97_00335 [Bacteroidota bacterium]